MISLILFVSISAAGLALRFFDAGYMQLIFGGVKIQVFFWSNFPFVSGENSRRKFLAFNDSPIKQRCLLLVKQCS